MATVTGIALYAALCSDVYHHNDIDQWINLKDIDGTLLPGNALNAPDVAANLVLAGFTAAPDGFYYTPNGFGARLVLDGDKYIIVYRGTDFDTLKWPEVKASLNASFLNREAATGYNPPSTDKNDIGDIVADVQIGGGAWHKDDQAQDAIKFAQTVLGFVSDPSKVIVTGQSLGGGLAGIVSAKFAIKSYVFDPAPFARYINVMAEEAAFKQMRSNQTLPSAVSEADIAAYLTFHSQSIETLLQLKGWDLQNFLQLKNSNIAAYKANIVSLQTGFRVSGEALDSASIIGAAIGIAGIHFTNNVTGIDIGQPATGNVIGALSLHSPHLLALAARTSEFAPGTGAVSDGQESFAKLLREDATLRSLLIDEARVIGALDHKRGDIVLRAASADPGALAQGNPSQLAEMGADQNIVYRALWKDVGTQDGLYSYFYKLFNGVLGKGAGAAAPKGAANDGFDTTTYGLIVPPKTSLHSGVVKLALQVLRDAAQDTETVDALGVKLLARTGSSVAFAGADATGTAPDSNKIVIYRVITVTVYYFVFFQRSICPSTAVILRGRPTGRALRRRLVSVSTPATKSALPSGRPVALWSRSRPAASSDKPSARNARQSRIASSGGGRVAATRSSGRPAQWAAELDHGQSAACLAKRARTGFNST
jgi:hypothetical protein